MLKQSGNTAVDYTATKQSADTHLDNQSPGFSFAKVQNAAPLKSDFLSIIRDNEDPYVSQPGAEIRADRRRLNRFVCSAFQRRQAGGRCDTLSSLNEANKQATTSKSLCYRGTNNLVTTI